MQVIKNWLQGRRNFYTGRAIYAIIGDNAAVRALLDQGESDFAMQKLIAYFEAFSIDQLSSEKQTPEAGETMPDSDNEILIAIKNEWMPLFQKMNYLRHQLDKDFEDENSPEAINYRLPIAREILDTEKKVIAIWQKRDYYLQHGSLPFEPEKTTEVPTDPLELANFLNNIKRNIRHNTKMLRENPDNPKYAALLLHYKKLVFQITGKE